MLRTTTTPVVASEIASGFLDFQTADAIGAASECTATDPALSEADRALLGSVRGALHATGYTALRRVEIEICRGTVILWGRVPTYHLKQLAQWSVQQVTGVRGVGNGLEVVCSRSRLQ